MFSTGIFLVGGICVNFCVSCNRQIYILASSVYRAIYNITSYISVNIKLQNFLKLEYTSTAYHQPTSSICMMALTFFLKELRLKMISWYSGADIPLACWICLFVSVSLLKAKDSFLLVRTTQPCVILHTSP